MSGYERDYQDEQDNFERYKNVKSVLYYEREMTAM